MRFYSIFYFFLFLQLHYAASYDFGYRVRDPHTGNYFGHQESKKGEETNGQYHVLLPDGRMQQVKYSAGPDGFHADISYDHLQQAHWEKKLTTKKGCEKKRLYVNVFVLCWNSARGGLVAWPKKE